MSDIENKRKIHIKKRTIYASILIVMLLCFLMIGFLLLFQVRKIKIEGNKYLTQQEILDWVQKDELSSNSVYLWGKYKIGSPELLPLMEELNIKLQNPWSVIFMVSEKPIIGYVEEGQELVYFDQDGTVLAKTQEWWDDVPQVEGLEVEEAKLYKKLAVTEKNKKAFENLLGMTTMLQKYELTPDRVICEDADLYLYFGKICVILGHENMGDRIAQIPPILEKLEGQSGTLHLERYESNDSIISFEKDVLPTFEEEK